MIGSAVSQITAQLNEYLKHRFGVAEDLVDISAVTGSDATGEPRVSNRLHVFLVHVEQDPAARDGPPQVAVDPPIFLTIHLMVAARFAPSDYDAALRLIAGATAFFQMRPILDHAPRVGREDRATGHRDRALEL